MTAWKTTRAANDDPQRPALFLDRDGVVIRDRDYLGDPAGVEVLPGVAEGMIRARAAGFLLIGVSNQSGIGRGYFTTADFEAVMTRLAADLEAQGASFDGFFYCPHEPSSGCRCRKPLPGLLGEAAKYFRWDPARSWVVGDKASDMALGLDAGLGAVLVRTGYGAAAERLVAERWPDAERRLVADDLSQAVKLILAAEETEPAGRTP